MSLWGQAAPPVGKGLTRGPANATFHTAVQEMVAAGLPVCGNHSQGIAEVLANTSLPGEEVFRLPTFSTAAKVRVGITVCLFLSSACFNIAVLWTIAQKYQRRPHVRILLMNLAAADLLVTFVVMPLDAAWNVTLQWYAGDAACRLLMFLKLAVMYASAFVTVVISLDRRAAILHPLSVGEAKRRNKVMLCVAWALSGLLASPQVGGLCGDAGRGRSFGSWVGLEVGTGGLWAKSSPPRPFVPQRTSVAVVQDGTHNILKKEPSRVSLFPSSSSSIPSAGPSRSPSPSAPPWAASRPTGRRRSTTCSPSAASSCFPCSSWSSATPASSSRSPGR